MDDSNIEKLIEDLKDSDWSVRFTAAGALKEIKDPSCVPALCEALKDSVSDVRRWAALALASIGIPAVPALIEALKDSKSDVRKWAAWALGEIKDPSAVAVLCEALKDSEVCIQNKAADALVRIGVPAVPALSEALKDSDSDVRWRVAVALGWIGDSKTLPRKILASSRLTAQKRIEALDALRKARRGAFTTRLFSFPETRNLCESVLLEEDLDARTGAQAVLDWMNGDKNLLRASQPDASKEGKELLRAASGVPDIEPSSLLRASDKPVKEPGLPIAKT